MCARRKQIREAVRTWVKGIVKDLGRASQRQDRGVPLITLVLVKLLSVHQWDFQGALQVGWASEPSDFPWLLFVFDVV